MLLRQPIDTTIHQECVQMVNHSIEGIVFVSWDFTDPYLVSTARTVAS